MTAIKIDRLSYTYSRWGQQVDALKDISFEIEKGDFVVIAGPNGSGKSTLLEIISGMRNDFKGEIKINGTDIKALKRQNRLFEHVFYMPQNVSNGSAPLLTVFENLFVSDLTANREGKDRKELESKYSGIIEMMGGDFGLNQTASTLSGGQKQLLSLAIGCIRNSDIILLDEPTASLDPGRLEFAGKIIEKIQKSGRTIVLITHNRSQAISMGNRTMGLKEGKIVYNKHLFDRNSENIGVIWD
jgi:ABC-type multidrug transport system ATPase subunit